MSQIDPMTLLMAGSAFVLVMATWLFGVLWWASRKLDRKTQIRKRLDPATNQSVVDRTLRLWHEGGEAMLIVTDEAGPSMREQLARFCKDAGWSQSVGRLLFLLVAGLLLVGTGTALLTDRLLAGIMASGAFLVAARWYAGVRVHKSRKLFEQQLIDGLELSARSLRAGHPLLSSFQLIAEEISPPIGDIFGDICQEHEMGIDLESSLRGVARRTRNSDMRLFSASLAINLRAGGNLASVVEGLAAVIRERFKLQRRFRVLTAQTQLSKRILIAMPIVMFCVINLLNPVYIDPLYTTGTGQLILLTAFVSLCVGWWVMNKMSAIHS